MKKLIIKAAKLFAAPNAALEILDSIAFIGDRVEFTDLEIFVSIPFKTGINTAIPIHNFVTAMEALDSPSFKDDVSKKEIGTIEKPKTHIFHKVTISEGKQAIKVSGNDLGDWPKMPSDDDKKGIGVLPATLLPTLKDSMLFQSLDDLRPAMTYTYLKTHVVATDAHRLMFIKLDTPFKEEIFLHKKVIKLMEIFGGDWIAAMGYDKKRPTIQQFTNEDGVKIVCRHPDVRFPDWQVVVPVIDAETPSATLNKKEILQAIKIGSKFGNRSTKQSTFALGEKKSTFSTADVDFDTEYSTEITAPNTKEMEIAFNWDFVKQILDLSGETVKMHYWSPNKATIFDGKYLLMPGLLNR